MIGKTLSVVSVVAVLISAVQGYRTNDAKSQKEDGSSNSADLKLAFSAFDKDNSGHISVEELKEVLTAIGHAPTESQLKEITKLADKDGNGEISLPEFMELAKEYKDVDFSLKKTFNEIDADKSGHITAEELHAWLTKLGKKMSEKQVEQLIKNADEDDDEEIHFSEFVKLVKNLA